MRIKTSQDIEIIYQIRPDVVRTRTDGNGGNKSSVFMSQTQLKIGRNESCPS